MPITTTAVLPTATLAVPSGIDLAGRSRSECGHASRTRTPAEETIMLHKDSEPTLCSRIALPGREASTNIVVRAPRRALESSPELPPSIEAPSFLFLAGVAAGLALALVFGTMSPRRGAEVRYDVCSAVATMAGLRCTE